ncbi:transposase [Thalassobacillus sp. CUG 92003]|uniref:transposase n=1 Tax=Thalassobacillus sp. CUG 92003 TaxID=2736641 RepID=UPI0015E63595|nr:transposase [Thalassobacillus sp. CUG 92003]
MPTVKRRWYPGVYYHVVTRGNNRQPIYHDQADYEHFFALLMRAYTRYPFQLAAYCLMGNHYHLLMKGTSTPNLSHTMHLLNLNYSKYYHKKYDTTGHLFEKRYFADMVPDLGGMLEVSFYIHANPLRAEVSRTFEDYP